MTSKLKRRILLIFSGLVRGLTAPLLTEIPQFRQLRGHLYGLGMKARGRRFEVSNGVYIWGLENLSVGDDVYIAPGVTVICPEQVVIGDGVMLSPGVVVDSGNHLWREGRYQRHESELRPISIGAGTWIAANATVVAGATIGTGVLVAANSVVTNDVPDGAVVGGVPARVLRHRDRSE